MVLGKENTRGAWTELKRRRPYHRIRRINRPFNNSDYKNDIDTPYLGQLIFISLFLKVSSYLTGISFVLMIKVVLFARCLIFFIGNGNC